MIRNIIRFLAAFSSTLLFLLLYGLQVIGSKEGQPIIEEIYSNFEPYIGKVGQDLRILILAILFLLIWLLFNWILLFVIREFSIFAFENLKEPLHIKEVGIGNSHFFGFYLAFFFAACGIAPTNYLLAIVCYFLLFLLCFVSNDYYFNPVLLLQGYHFYNVRTEEGVLACVISKQKIRTPENIDSEKENYIRINSFTFWEI